jgi:hypothetical protein
MHVPHWKEEMHWKRQPCGSQLPPPLTLDELAATLEEELAFDEEEDATELDDAVAPPIPEPPSPSPPPSPPSPFRPLLPNSMSTGVAQLHVAAKGKVSASAYTRRSFFFFTAKGLRGRPGAAPL